MARVKSKGREGRKGADQARTGEAGANKQVQGKCPIFGGPERLLGVGAELSRPARDEAERVGKATV